MWLQLKRLGALRVQHLRNSDPSFSALFKRLITHSTRDECNQNDHPPPWPRRGELPLQNAPSPADHCLHDHLTLAPLQGLKPGPSTCDHPFSWPADVISRSAAGG